MLCLRCKALPTLRSAVSGARVQMNSVPQLVAQPKTTTSSLLSSRQFSSLLSTPTRPSLAHAISNIPSTQTTSAVSSSSLLASQTRSFSASASLGVRRVTYRPSRRVQKRRSGFLARNKTSKGRQVLTHRRLKGRKAMSW